MRLCTEAASVRLRSAQSSSCAEEEDACPASEAATASAQLAQAHCSTFSPSVARSHAHRCFRSLGQERLLLKQLKVKSLAGLSRKAKREPGTDADDDEDAESEAAAGVAADGKESKADSKAQAQGEQKGSAGSSSADAISRAFDQLYADLRVDEDDKESRRAAP